MDSTRHHVLLFGDQTDNVVSTIRDLYVSSKESGLLAKFLRDASDICQIEFGNLQPCFRKETPPFETLLEMAQNLGETNPPPVLASSAVSYFARLGELILRAEHDPTILSGPRVLIGLCINLFQAALAATARSASELARLSLQGFPSYFTWAVTNHARTKQIEWQHGIWSCMAWTSKPDTPDGGFSPQLLLDTFHKNHDIPEHKKAWIGVVGDGWVTVSGPPSILKLLMAESVELSGLSLFPLPIASAVHAPHLPAFDFESTAKPSYIWDLPLQKGACIISPDECIPYTEKTLGEVARRIVPAVLSTPLMVEKMFVATAEYLKKACATAAISILGPSAQSVRLIHTVRNAGVQFDVLPRPESTPNAQARSGSGAVAIVGMSARFPQANDLEQFWKLLMEGRTTHERVPPDRFDLENFHDPSGTKKNTMMNTDGCFLSDPGAFDTRLFNMSPREAMQVDPTHRLLLMTSLEALEKAGYNPDNGQSSLNRRTAVYFGQNADVWRDFSAEQGVDVFTAPGILRAFSPGRVSYHFGFQGGSYSIDSACSSSATAIQLACASLIERECDMALAGGAQIAGSPFEFSALGKSGFLAPSGGCKTFRADADGYCRGEAVGVLVLKRLEDAVADNDKIEAVITGWGRNYSAGASSMTHPCPKTQEKLMRQVLRQANMKPHDVGYVELHGTGTTVGDMAEMTSVTRAFGKHLKKDLSIPIGSVKANVGHSESAAGVSSVIKAALMLRNGAVPPQAMVTPETQLHPGFASLNMSCVRIDSAPSMLESNKERILVNSFDAAGGNTCLLIESASRAAEIVSNPDPRNWHIVVVSAQGSKSLQDNKANLLEYLVKYPETQLSNVAYSTTARRRHYSCRSEYTAESTGQLVEQLRKGISNPNRNVNATTAKPKVIFLFNGQGTSYYHIARELYTTHPAFKEYLNTLQGICKKVCKVMFCDIISILTDPKSRAGDHSVVEEHLAIVCIQLALAQLWKSWGIEPDIVLGHSIGEYAALSVAGVLSVTDTLWLVSERSALFLETFGVGEYGMLSLSATAGDVRALLYDGGSRDTCEIACFNSDAAHVVGGPMVDLHDVESRAKTKGIPTQLLSMSCAVHCKPMQSIYDQLEKTASKVSFFRPQIPVASTVTGEIVVGDGVFNAQYVARHARQPVQFSKALQSASAFLSEHKAAPSPLWMQIGPGMACLSLMRQTLAVASSQLLPSLGRLDDSSWKVLTSSLGKAYAAGAPIDWPEFHRPFVRSLRLLDLPTYAFDLKTFWRPYTMATASANGISMDHVGLQSPAFVPTATIQKIGHRKASSQRIEVTFVSSLSDSRLRDAIKGHSIEGVGICPASMYVDMAFTAAAYVHRTVWPEKEKSLGTLKRLELNSPLVLREDSERQTVEVRVVAEEKDSWKANVSFYSQTGDGQFEQHGSCQVLDSSETIEAAQEDMITQARIRSALMMHTNDHSDAQIDHLHRRMFYKLYGTVVKYDSRYQGIVEAFVKETPETPGTIEAVAEVKLTATPDGERGAFMVNPYYSDSLVHIGGFALNTKLSDDDEDVLYFSSGIGSITLLHEIDEKTTYRSYLWASVNPEGDSEASVYILNENELVGAVTGLTFRRIKREFLKALLQQAQSNGEAPTAAQSRETSAQPNSKGPSSIAEAAVPRPTRGHGKMADAFISAVVAETGINQEDIEDSTKLSELGVDSLMGMAIIRRVKADTGQILPVSILSELQTVRDVRERLDPCPHKSEGRSVDLVTRYKSNAVLLQGHADSPNRPLFFVAGSGGSASIYAQLPNLASDTPIWVLESPFLNLPSEMNYSPQEIAPIYVAAVKAIRPTGPYLLGGYSAGAVHAYEIARLMLDGGDDVDKLILVDMKAHRPGETWEEAPRMEDVEMLYDFLQVGDNAPATASPGTHREQLEREGRFASLRCMYNWKPTPMDPSRRPKNGTVMIWARWGVRQYSSREERGPGFYVNPMAAENRDYKSWFTAPRHTFDANGWDILVGDIQTHVVFGDHWSMLQRPFAAELSTLIDQALTSRRNNKVEHNEQDR